MGCSRLSLSALCFAFSVFLNTGLPTVKAAEPYYGKFIGALRTQHHGVTGDVYAVDSRNLHIRNFNYDGEGPAAYFYAGNTKAPSSSGFQLRDEKGKSTPLKKYRNEHVTVTLPDGKTLNNIKWFSVWCDEFAVNFADVKIPKNFEYPKPQKIGQLSGIHGVSSDNVVVVDAQTLLIQSFSYDGEAPDAKFWVGPGPKPSPQGIRVPDENGKVSPLKRYNRKHIVLTLPRDLTVFDIGHFGVWCEAFTVDFGHIEIPSNSLNVPPSLKMLGVSPQKSPQSLDQLLGLIDQQSVNLYQPKDTKQTQQLYYQQQPSQIQSAYQQPQLIPYQQSVYVQQPSPYNQQILVQQPSVLNQQPFVQQPLNAQQSVAAYNQKQQQYIIDPTQQNNFALQLLQQQKQSEQQPEQSQQSQLYRGQEKRTQSQTSKRQQPNDFNESFFKYDNIFPLLNIRNDTLRPTTYKPPLRQYLEESSSTNNTNSQTKNQSGNNNPTQLANTKDNRENTVVQIVPSVALNGGNIIYPPEFYNNVYDPYILYNNDNNVRYIDNENKNVGSNPNGLILSQDNFIPNHSGPYQDPNQNGPFQIPNGPSPNQNGHFQNPNGHFQNPNGPFQNPNEPFTNPNGLIPNFNGLIQNQDGLASNQNRFVSNLNGFVSNQQELVSSQNGIIINQNQLISNQNKQVLEKLQQVNKGIDKPSPKNQTQSPSLPSDSTSINPSSLITITQPIDNFGGFPSSGPITPSQGGISVSTFRQNLQPLNVFGQPSIELNNLRYSGPSVPPPHIQSLSVINGLHNQPIATSNAKPGSIQSLPQSQPHQATPITFHSQSDARPPIYPNIQPENVRIVTYNQAPHLQVQQNPNSVYILPSTQILSESQPPSEPVFDPNIVKSFSSSHGLAPSQSLSRFSFENRGRIPQGFSRF